MKEKKIPTKNYVILLFLILGTFIVTIYLANVYKNKLEYQNSQELTMDILLQLSEEDVANYVVENHDRMIYLSNNQQDTNINEKMKKLIIENEYTEDIVYINTDSMNDEFYSTFTNTYYSNNLKEQNVMLEQSPTLLIIKGGEVFSALTIQEYDKETITTFIEEKYYGVE